MAVIKVKITRKYPLEQYGNIEPTYEIETECDSNTIPESMKKLKQYILAEMEEDKKTFIPNYKTTNG